MNRFDKITSRRGQMGFLAGYGLAVVSTALAALARWLLPWALTPAPYLGFYPAVVLSAALGGVGPGLVSTFGSLFMVNFVFGRFNPHDSGAMMRQVIWVAASVGVSLLAGWQRAAWQRAEQEAETARSAEEHFRAFFQTASVGAAELGLDGRIMEVNGRLCEITGFSHEELLRMTPAELTHPDDRQHEDQRLADYLAGQSALYNAEKRYVRKDGRVIWVQVSAAMIHDASGKQLRSAAIIQDITERREAEEKLRTIATEMLAANAELGGSRRAAINLLEDALNARRQTEEAATALSERDERLRLALEAADFGTWDLDLVTGKAIRSLRHDQIFGYQELQPVWSLDIALQHVLPEDHQKIIEAHTPAPGRTSMYVEGRMRRIDGSIGWVMSTGRFYYDDDGGPVRIIGVCADITERKRAEEALRLSEEKFNTAFANNPAAIALTRLDDGLFSEVNNTWLELNGRTREETIGRTSRTMGIWPNDEDAARFLNELRTKGVLRNWEQAFYKKSGEMFVAEVSAQLLTVHGEQAILSILVDITARKRAEEALARAYEQTEADRRRLETILEISPVGVVLVEASSGVLSLVNRRAAEIYGIDYGGLDLEAHLAKANALRPDGTIFPVEQLPATLAFRGEEVRSVEMTIDRPDGIRVPLIVSAAPLQHAEGNVTTAVIVFDDITERKLAEQAIRESEERYRRLIQSIQVPLGVVNKTGDSIFFNDSFTLLFGYTLADLPTVDSWWQRAYPDEAYRLRVVENWQAKMRRSVQSLTETEPEELNVTCKDGSVRVVVISNLVIEDMFVATFVDITERKAAEEALRESRHMLAEAEGLSHTGAWEWDLVADKWNFSDEWLAIHGCPKRTLTSEELLPIAYPEDLEIIACAMEELRAGTRPFDLEHRIVRQNDGAVRVVHSRGQFVSDGAGMVIRVYGFAQDVTERKMAEERLRASLHEKDVMLKEIHHRVKNNLQVISSLVGLQAEGSDDEKVREVLRDVTYRVRSMAMVHEKLYQSVDLASVDFAEYAKSLLNYLWRAHGCAAAPVRLVFDMHPLLLPVDTAVPCGLILNELAGNALKHAFNGRESGEVTVSLQGTPEGRVSLSLRDNGVGLPDGFDWRQSRSLGLRLVQMLAGQLNATVEVSSEVGTKFEITFEYGTENPKTRRRSSNSSRPPLKARGEDVNQPGLFRPFGSP